MDKCHKSINTYTAASTTNRFCSFNFPLTIYWRSHLLHLLFTRVPFSHMFGWHPALRNALIKPLYQFVTSLLISSHAPASLKSVIHYLINHCQWFHYIWNSLINIGPKRPLHANVSCFISTVTFLYEVHNYYFGCLPGRYNKIYYKQLLRQFCRTVPNYHRGRNRGVGHGLNVYLKPPLATRINPGNTGNQWTMRSLWATNSNFHQHVEWTVLYEVLFTVCVKDSGLCPLRLLRPWKVTIQGSTRSEVIVRKGKWFWPVHETFAIIWIVFLLFLAVILLLYWFTPVGSI